MRIVRGAIYRFFRDDEGVAAIEFALVVIPVTFIMIGIIEISMLFAASTQLDAATGEAARALRTGQLQEMSDTADAKDEFEDIVCQNIKALMDCDGLQYETVKVNDFTAAAGNNASFDDGVLENDGNFELGGPDEVMLIRTAYQYPISTPAFQQFFANDPDNDARIISTTKVLKVEPYKFEQNGSN